MIAFVVLVERMLSGNDLSHLGGSQASWRWSERQTRSIARGSKILCFGSSLTKFAVLPAILERETGLPTLNLAVYGGRISSSYFLLKHALVRGAEPVAIVIDCIEGPSQRSGCDRRHETLAENLANWPEILSAFDCLELSWQARDAEFLAETLLSKTLESFHCRREIRKDFELAIHGETDPFDSGLLKLLRNWNVNRGAQVAIGQHRSAAVSEPSLAPRARRPSELEPARWVRNSLADHYLRRFLDLAASRKIAVFLIMPPLSPTKQAENDGLGLSLHATRRAVRLLGRYANVTVVEGRYAGYDHSVFLDDTHLNAGGLVPFSHDLGALVAGRLAWVDSAPRWLSAPNFSARATDVFLEPIEESGRIVASRIPSYP